MKNFLRHIFYSAILCLPLGGYAQSTANYPFTTNTTGSFLLDANSNAVDMSAGTTTLVAGGNDDAVSSATNIGFPFAFMGVVYTSFYANSNGYIGLGATTYSSSTNDLTDATNKILAPFWDDIAVHSTGKVHSKVVGTAPNRCLVVEFLNMEIRATSTTADATFQVRIYESSGLIEFMYGNMVAQSATAPSASIGITAGSGNNTFRCLTDLAATPATTPTAGSEVTTLASGFSNGATITNLHSTTNGSRRTFRFTPSVTPTASASLSFASVTATGMTLNWGNVTGELGYLVYVSLDGGTTYEYIANTAANTLTYVATGLNCGVTYFWRVYSLSEGKVSTAVQNSQATTTATLSGTKTIGTGGDYTTLTAALTAINSQGMSGSIILELLPAYTSTGETFPITFGSTSCGTAYTLTVRPQSGATNRIITSANTTATILINGRDNVIIDGRPGGAGTAKELTITNTDATSYAIILQTDATNNTVQYCKLRGQNTSALGAVVYFAGSATLTGNDNNTIDNCDITTSNGTTSYPTFLIYSSGTSTALANSDNTISNCFLYDFFNASLASGAIYLGSTGNDAWSIISNKIYQTATRTYTTSNIHRAIYVSSGNGYTISANTIGFANSSGTGTYTMTGVSTRFFGISIDVGATATTSIQGNIISGMALTTANVILISPGAWVGIAINSGLVDIGSVTGNVIGSNSLTNAIVITNTGAGSGNKSSGIYLNSNASALNISNNQVGGIVCAGNAAGVGTSFTAIESFVVGTLTISNNVVGSTTTANSITVGMASVTANCFFRGIYTEETSGVLQNNTVANTRIISSSGNNLSQLITCNPTSASSLSITNNTLYNHENTSSNAASSVRGIFCQTGEGLQITGNTIYGLSLSAPSTLSSSGIAGIRLIKSGSTNYNISNNLIHSLSQTSATGNVTISGIYYEAPNGTTGNIVAKNIIHSITASTSGIARIRGIDAGGTATTSFRNNMIRLGIDASGSNITNGYDITGIYLGGGTNSIYFNSVYVGGTGVASGTQNTYALYDVSVSDYRNNILANVRSNASGTGRNIAARYNGAIASNTVAGLASDYNIYQFSGTGGGLIQLGSTIYTIRGWRLATNNNYDVNSGFGNPNFTNATGNAAAVSLKLNSPNSAEGMATPIAGITDDQEGTVRDGTTPDIGADEDADVLDLNNDIYYPNILYTAFTSTSLTTNQILTATITDRMKGVPTSGADVPRIFFRRNGSGAWYSTAGTHTSGDGLNGTWDFTIDYALSGPVTTLDYVEYYVIAQDLANTPNIWAWTTDELWDHTNVSTQVIPVANPYNYFITGIVAGNFWVPNNPMNGDRYFPSFTNDGGIFEALNRAGIQWGGDVTIWVNGNSTIETGTHALNQMTEVGAGAGAYTLTIKPGGTGVGVTNEISSTTATAVPMMHFNGADRIIIDGLNTGGSALLFRNTNATSANTNATLQFSNGATDCTVTNAIIENNGTSTSVGSFYIKDNTTDANTITLSNSEIRNATGGTTGRPYRAFYLDSPTSWAKLDNNKIYNWDAYGIDIVATNIANNFEITNNHLYDTGTPSGIQNPIGISSSGSHGHIINGNYIGGNAMNATGTWTNSGGVSFTPIYLLIGNTTATTLNNNVIKNITMSSASANAFRGINNQTSGQITVDNLTMQNISYPNAIGASSEITGVYSTSTNTVIVQNSTFDNLTMPAVAANATKVRGLFANVTGTYTVSGCTFSNFSCGSNSATSTVPSVAGIHFDTSSPTLTLTGNTIYNLTSSHTTAGTSMYGILLSTTGATATLSKNRIYGLTNSSTSTSSRLVGFHSSGGTFTASNNQIYLTNGNSPIMYGIWDAVTTGTCYYNTVFVTGTANSTTNTAGYRREGTSTATLKNNIFINTRSGSTGKHYAMSFNNTTTALTSNYNLFVNPASANMINHNGTDRTIATWRTNSSQDVSSWYATSTAGTSDHSNINVANLFTATASGNLNINTANAECWFVNGKGVQITGYQTDFSTATNLRSALVSTGGTDIGSDEFHTATTPIAAKVTGTITASGTQTFDFANRTIASITWGAAGTLPTNLGTGMLYYSGAWPLLPTPGARYFNAYWRIDPVGGSGFTYSITLNYDDALIGLMMTESSTRMSKKPTNATSPYEWITLIGAGSVVNTVNNTLTSVTPLTTFSDFTGSDDSVPLPNFVATLHAKRTDWENIEIAWQTSDNSYWKEAVLEKSYEGGQFEPLTQYNSPDNRTVQYTHFDKEPKTALYRLRFVMQDNSLAYSSIARVLAYSDTQIGVYPNPLAGKVSFKLGTDITNNATNKVQVLNSAGKTVATWTGTWVEIEKQLNAQYPRWAKGVYLLQVQTTGKKLQTLKVVR